MRLRNLCQFLSHHGSHLSKFLGACRNQSYKSWLSNHYCCCRPCCYRILCKCLHNLHQTLVHSSGYHRILELCTCHCCKNCWCSLYIHCNSSLGRICCIPCRNLCLFPFRLL